MKRLFLTCWLLAAAGLFAADTVLLSLDAEKENGWDGGAIITADEAHFGNAAYLAKGRKRLTSLKKIEIDGERKYRASLWLKQQGETPSEVYVGWVCYDSKGQVIPSEAYHRVSGSFTMLAAPAKQGESTILLKDASKWRKGKTCVVAFNADKGDADLPNHDTSDIVTAVEKEGDAWRVTLANPLAADYPEGCGVREHLKGGDLYFFISKLEPGQWRQVQSPWTLGKNLRCASFVKLVIISNLATAFKDGRVLFDDVQVVTDGTNVSF